MVGSGGRKWAGEAEREVQDGSSDVGGAGESEDREGEEGLPLRREMDSERDCERRRSCAERKGAEEP